MSRIDTFEPVLKELHLLNAGEADGRETRPGLTALCDAAFGELNGSGVLNQVIVEGDHVAVAVVHAIAGVEAIVRELADRISAVTKQDPEQGTSGPVCFVFAPGTIDPGTVVALNENSSLIRCSVHDPENDQQKALLAIGCEANPLAINRELFDADVVMIVSSPNGTDLEADIPALFPTFGSAECRAHYETQKPKKQLADCQSVERSLGAELQIAVTTGPGGVPDFVFAGIGNGTSESIANRVRHCWTLEPTENLDLIVATIESPSGLRSWDEFFAALRIASQYAGEHAPLVVISQIDRAPPANVSRAIALAMDGDDHTSGQVPGEMQLTIGQRPVYLVSGLDRQTVEDLGFGYLESADELGRLVKRHSGCGLIRDAHKCISIGSREVVR